jgi:hypothetical protein
MVKNYFIVAAMAAIPIAALPNDNVFARATTACAHDNCFRAVRGAAKPPTLFNTD